MKDIKQVTNPKTGLPDNTGGDHSFKMWWYMMQTLNQYVTIFVVALGVFIFQIFKFSAMIDMLSETYSTSVVGGIFGTVACFVPLAVCVAVAYGFFYKHWNQICGNIKNS